MNDNFTIYIYYRIPEEQVIVTGSFDVSSQGNISADAYMGCFQNALIIEHAASEAGKWIETYP